MSEKSRKRLINVIRVVGGLLAFVWFGYGQYLNSKLPRMPDETGGRVYPLAFHGTDGYANQQEFVIYWAILFTGVALIIITTWIDIRTKKKD